MAQPEPAGPKRATAGWAPWVIGLGLLVAVGAGAAVIGTAPLALQTTQSGLRYQMLRSGDGSRAAPGPTDFVLVHYTGRLPDGRVFDSSYAGGRPVSFRVDQVIPGWTEALQLMRPGGQMRITVPARLGYGERGAGGVIPPNTDLTFDIELVDVATGQGRPG